MNGSSKRDARKATVAEKQRQALELRRSGYTYEMIARALGYSDRSLAARAVKSALKEIIREPAEEVLQLELGRLDGMLRGILDAAETGDVQAIDRALKIMDRRAKYLGLDAPTKVQDVSMTPEQAAQRYRELTGHEWKGSGDE